MKVSHSIYHVKFKTILNFQSSNNIYDDAVTGQKI